MSVTSSYAKRNPVNSKGLEFGWVVHIEVQAVSIHRVINIAVWVIATATLSLKKILLLNNFEEYAFFFLGICTYMISEKQNIFLVMSLNPMFFLLFKHLIALLRHESGLRLDQLLARLSQCFAFLLRSNQMSNFEFKFCLPNATTLTTEQSEVYSVIVTFVGRKKHYNWHPKRYMLLVHCCM